MEEEKIQDNVAEEAVIDTPTTEAVAEETTATADSADVVAESAAEEATHEVIAEASLTETATEETTMQELTATEQPHTKDEPAAESHVEKPLAEAPTPEPVTPEPEPTLEVATEESAPKPVAEVTPEPTLEPIAETHVEESKAVVTEMAGETVAAQVPVAEESSDKAQASDNDHDGEAVVEADDEDEFSEDATTSNTPTQKAPRKKFKFTKWMAVAAGFLAAFILTGIILAVIPYRNLSHDQFSGWTHVNIYDSGGFLVTIGNNHAGLENDLGIRRDMFEHGLDSTRHSLLRSIFEFNYVNDLRFRLNENHIPAHQKFDPETGYRYIDSNGVAVWIDDKVVTERQEFTRAQAHAQTEARGGTFMLDFFFPSRTPTQLVGADGNLMYEYDEDYNRIAPIVDRSQPQSITVRDNSDAAREARERNYTFYFNRVRILFNSSYGEIAEFVLFVYNSYDFEQTALTPFASENRMTPVAIRMDTTALYETLMDIREPLRFNRDNGAYVPDDDNNYENGYGQVE